MADRRGTTRPGNSYNDSAYDAIEAGLEAKHRLPKGIMRSIRTRGERSNADQVSEAGARSVYQVIPQTRAAFLKKYGVDAYASPEAAAEVAALHLKESYQRGGDWNAAVGEYHGGTDRRNWGSKTRAYVGRAGKGGMTVPAGENGATALAPGISADDLTAEDLLTMSPGDLGSRRPLGPQRKDPRMSAEGKRQARLATLTDDRGVVTGSAPDLRTDLSTERAQQAADVALQERKDSVSVLDQVYATVDSFLANQVVSALNQEVHEADPGFSDFYMRHWQTIEEFADSADEVAQLRSATSVADLQAIQERIGHQRGMDFLLDSGDSGTAWRLGGGLADPAGWLAGLGTGKLFEMAGIGSRALMAQGKTAGAVGSLAGEGALGNLAFTGALDSAGVDQDSTDYLLSGASGLAIGAGLSPLVIRGAVADEASSIVRRLAEGGRMEVRGIAAEARTNAGPEATPEQVRAEEQRIQTERTRDLWRASLADVPDELKLLSDDPEVMLTADAATAQRVVDDNGLTAISDDAERAMTAELLARSKRMLEANPIDEKALQTSLRLVGMESTGNTLLSSKSPVARAVGLTLLESSTGAGGRRSTAAMAQAARERVYNRHMVEYDSLYHQFRKGEGVGLVSDAWNGEARRRFNDRVFAEVEARAETPNGWTRDANPAVVRAADLFERGMTAMRVEQQHVGTVGFARLGSTSRGYMPHRLDPRGVLALTKEQRARLTDILTEQFVDPANGFDRAFSRKLATKYLERARDAASGSYEVPFNLHSSDAADMVRDSLEALRESAKLSEADIDKMVGKFARGGAGHTKRRLKLDLDADIGDGLKLRDIFVTDVPSLFRGYARRVSGEVALAQFGIMGKKGLNVLRKAIQETGGDPARDLRAFDQIAAEFLNTPYGEANYAWLDNTRIVTSLARLGGMGITQFAEYGNGMAAVGAARVFSAIGGMRRLSKEVTHLQKGGESANPILASLDTMGGDLGMDDYQLTRMFDVRDNDIQLYSSERLGVFTRAVRAGGNLQASASFHRRIAAIQTRGMAEQIVRKAVAMVKRGGNDIALDDMGINAEMRAALARDLDQIATFDSRGKLQSLDLRKSTMDPYTLREFRDAIERGSSQIIQRTYKGETGKWSHNGFLKLLLQFRTFSVVSLEKQWGRNVKSRGAAGAFLALMGAMSFAAPIHMARMQGKMIGMSRSEREKFADRNLTPLAVGRATLNYASAAGLLGDVLDLGGGFAVDFGLMDPDEVPFMGARGQGRGSLIGGTVAPGIGLLEDVWDGVHGDGKKLAKALPGANLPYVSPLITGLTSD